MKIVTCDQGYQHRDWQPGELGMNGSRDGNLWKLDLDERGYPWQAHLIVTPDAVCDRGFTHKDVTAACGHVFHTWEGGTTGGQQTHGLPMGTVHCGVAGVTREADTK